jgi:hypothetical protein
VVFNIERATERRSATHLTESRTIHTAHSTAHSAMIA